MVSQVGSRDQSWSIAQKMFCESEAYREFLLESIPRLRDSLPAAMTDLRTVIDWQDLPVLTKSAFYSKHPLRAIIPESNKKKIFSYTRSSGTSSFGRDGDKKSSMGFFWPELKHSAGQFADEFTVL